MRPRLIAPLALAFALIAGLLVILSSSGNAGDHRLSLIVPDAGNVIAGHQVRAAGQKVGTVSTVETAATGRHARIEIEIDDDRVWPLPPDTRFSIRFGGAVAYTARYISIERGRAGGRPLREGQIVPTRNVQVPAEFTDVLAVFEPRTRANLRASFDNAGPALDAARRPLGATLDRAPPAVEQAEGLLADLGEDPVTLGRLVRTTDEVVAAIESSRPGLGGLIDDASTTLQAVSARAERLGVAIDEAPETLVAARQTLATAEPVLARTGDLAERVRPGVEELDRLVEPLGGTLSALVEIGPDARRTLRTLRTSSGDITAMLAAGADIMPAAESAARRLRHPVRCLRPYAPEIAGFASTWTGFTAIGDFKDKFGRLYVGSHAFPNGTTQTIPEMSRQLPGSFQTWAYPRPPGALVNQPWFQPDCNVTADGLDPQNAPETVASDPTSVQLVEIEPDGGSR